MNFKLVFIYIICLLSSLPFYGQERKFTLSVGYGLAGSFYTRSIVEDIPIDYPEYEHFAKMNFLGTMQTLRAGYTLSKDWSINIGFHFQHFVRKVKFQSLLNGVSFNIDKHIHHRDYVSFTNIQKNIRQKRHSSALGFGLYYIRAKSEFIESGIDFYNNVEVSFKNANAHEFGIFPELSYSYAFQPRVNVGLKTQFFYTLSAKYAESFSFYPFIQFDF